MTDRLPIMTEPEPIRSNAHAADVLADTTYLAYVMVQAMKLFIALIGKRWPEVR